MSPIKEKFHPNVPEENRNHEIEAVIVRIMKARKTLTHAELISEARAQLPLFRPDEKVRKTILEYFFLFSSHSCLFISQQVRNRIEDLINREYLTRDETDRNVYHYVA
jgi:cullin 3